MRKFNWKKSVAIALSTVCMVGALVGCGSNSASSDNGNDGAKAEKLSGSITAAGSSALKPLVDDAAALFNEKYPDVNITIDAGGSGEGLKQVSEGTVNIGNSDVEAAEKLDAILDLMEFSSRMKDYYDIYYLANKFDFNGKTLTEALKRTFENRGHSFTIEQFDRITAFADDEEMQKKWKAFTHKINTKTDDFNTVLKKIKSFLTKPLTAAVKSKAFTEKWSAANGEWM